MEQKALPEVCHIQYGYPFDSKRFSDKEGFPLIRIRDVVRGHTETFTTESCNDEYIVKKGDILIGMDGMFNVAKWKGNTAYLNQRVCKIEPNSSIVADYLFYYLPCALKKIENKTAFVTVKHLKAKQLNSILIPCPPVKEQKRIAQILDLLFYLICQKKKQLNYLDELVKSRFVELFGNPVINQKRFPVKQVGDVIDFIGGSQPPKNVFEYTPTEENIRLIQIRDYRTDKYKTYIPRKLAKRFCTADDIMIGRYGPPIFQILGGIEGSYNVALMKAVPKMGNREFIRWFLKQECLLHYLEGMSKRTAGQDGIQMDKLKKYPFPYPPIELQNQFANFAKQLDKSKYREAIFLYLLEDVLHML